MALKFISAEEAADFVHDGDQVGFSGFTAAGAPRVVPGFIAKKAEAEHAAGRPFQIGVFTGASTGEFLDGVLARAHAIKTRTPYQSTKDLRTCINSNETQYFDIHLSELAQSLRSNFFGKINVAIIEAADITDNGEVILTAGVGISPTICRLADKIIIELNKQHPKALRGIHDIYEPMDVPFRKEIPIYTPTDRAGVPYVKVDLNKVVGIVETDVKAGGGEFTPADEVTSQIGANVAGFLESEMKAGRIPSSFLPIQSGVGNVANAVLGFMGENKNIPAFNIYTEVIQDAVIALMKQDRVKFASGCSLTLSESVLQEVYNDLDYFKPKLVLRPQEISNNPGLVRRMGLITINTALEADIYGNINSTHVCGTKMMNGIGGSGDFTRNAYLPIFTTPSIAKGGKISSIVPMVSHADHSEHSVKVLITELGVADLRGKSPVQRAKLIIDNCVHPEYKEMMYEYMRIAGKGHTPHDLRSCFALHNELNESGDMRNTDFNKYLK
ncbi:MAG: succinate CoA transferase [Bacteroidales bacterium]|nr:succinate CoA transferase [Bacteroidales bacterium]